MNNKPVHERISGRVVSYMPVGLSFSQSYLENIIKEELAPLEAQLQQADATATAMGLALTEARMENERLREALEPFAKIVVDSRPEIVPNGYSNPEVWR